MIAYEGTPECWRRPQKSGVSYQTFSNELLAHETKGHDTLGNFVAHNQATMLRATFVARNICCTQQVA